MYQNNPYFVPNAFNLPKYEIIKVNGKSGAEAFQMSANSSVILLDENEPRIFVATTDGAGYKTVTAYKIEPYAEPKPVDLNSLEERILKLEEKINESYNRKFEPKQKQQSFNAQSNNKE